MDLADPIAVALAIAEALRGEAIPHALYGGLLLAAYGEARETKDVDLAVVRAETERVAGILDARLGLRTIVAFDRRTFGGLRIGRISLVEDEDLNTLDLVEPVDADYARRALERGMDSTLRGQGIRVLGPEDFVLFKLLSTRERDLDDARSVVRSLGPELDRGLVEQEIAALEGSLPEPSLADR